MKSQRYLDRFGVCSVLHVNVSYWLVFLPVQAEDHTQTSTHCVFYTQFNLLRQHHDLTQHNTTDWLCCLCFNKLLCCSLQPVLHASLCVCMSAVFWPGVVPAAQLWERNVEMSCVQVWQTHTNMHSQTVFTCFPCVTCLCCVCAVKQLCWRVWRWISTCWESSSTFKSKKLYFCLSTFCHLVK